VLAGLARTPVDKTELKCPAVTASCSPPSQKNWAQGSGFKLRRQAYEDELISGLGLKYSGTNAITTAANASAAIPVRAFKWMSVSSVMIFLRRPWEDSRRHDAILGVVNVKSRAEMFHKIACSRDGNREVSA
jgi:hypothetical protein